MKNILTTNGLVKNATELQYGTHQMKHLMGPMTGITIIATLVDINGAL